LVEKYAVNNREKSNGILVRLKFEHQLSFINQVKVLAFSINHTKTITLSSLRAIQNKLFTSVDVLKWLVYITRPFYFLFGRLANLSTEFHQTGKEPNTHIYLPVATAQWAGRRALKE